MTKSSSPRVIHFLALLVAVFVSALLISFVFICCKRCGRCDQLRNATLESNDNQQKEDTMHSITIPKSKTKSVQTVQIDDEDDSAFEDEPLISVEKKTPKCVRIEILQKLHNLILNGEDQELGNFCQEFDKEYLEKLNHTGFNSLHISAKCVNLNIFKQLLKFNVDIESLTADGRNSLHIAAFYGSHSICEYILERRKDLFDVTDRYNMNPAHWAALAGQVSILELLSQYGCSLYVRTSKYEENIVLFACIGENYDVLKFVGSKEDTVSLLHATNREGRNSIQYAAKSGNLKVFKYLCDKGVTIYNTSKQTGKNCLHTACEKGNIEICRYILKERNDRRLITELDKHEQHVGHFAAKGENIEILELLIKTLSDAATLKPRLLENATADNINILHIACRHARFDMCVKIADTFPDLINKITEKGWNAALFITEKAGAENDRILILKFLEERGLNVYHVTTFGKTILYNACVNRSAKLVKYLLKNYPDLLNIEKSMDPRKAANSQEIGNVFKKHLDKQL